MSHEERDVVEILQALQTVAMGVEAAHEHLMVYIRSPNLEISEVESPDSFSTIHS